ncbi:MAG TPA: ribosome biogenesis GTP-binding protein YihA/YsxC [Saprospiraceae bacterium]|nr:ribosome biogenesis GTP-binding protein YihA/YsxC [Saprospiraceae bacterium]HPI05030.1 ribosome biogenesis GTP-binding protein YihA/YsxC [Saprospiraceae bacterium]
MEVKSAEFIASYPKVTACPKDGKPEFAFIGRSNVGKSSLINMLTHKGLAKVSGTPGKTRLLNFFLINQSWYLVDLPGYGYARVSKSEQRNLQGMINSYFKYREELISAFVLIDSTISPTKIDLDFINGLGEAEVPFVIVFTKTDRIGSDTMNRNIEAFMGKLAETWENLPAYFISSAEKRIGRTELLEFIAKWSRKAK